MHSLYIFSNCININKHLNDLNGSHKMDFMMTSSFSRLFDREIGEEKKKRKNVTQTMTFAKVQKVE